MMKWSRAARYAAVGFGVIIILSGALMFARGGGHRPAGILLIAITPMIFGLARGSKSTSASYAVLSSGKRHKMISTWPIGLTIFCSLIGSFYLLHLDALNGHDDVFPVYYFSLSTIMAMGYFIYVTMSTE